jgi:DNA-binding response OmpR family regulator
MGKKVLIVEDEEGIANAFKKQLELIGGFEVEIAPGGNQALGFLAKTQVDVILLDLVMPEVDGVSVLSALKEDQESCANKYNQAPVIILTNVTSEETKSETQKFGIKDYIVKTDVQPDVLIDKINAVL